MADYITGKRDKLPGTKSIKKLISSSHLQVAANVYWEDCKEKEKYILIQAPYQVLWIWVVKNRTTKWRVKAIQNKKLFCANGSSMRIMGSYFKRYGSKTDNKINFFCS